VELGVRFTANIDGVVLGVRYFRGPGNDGPHPVRLWTEDGRELAAATSGGPDFEGWQQTMFDTPVEVAAGRVYVASYHAPVGRYPATVGGLTASVGNGPLAVPASSTVGGNGVYRYGPGGFPDRSHAATNYWVDVIFDGRGGPVVVGRDPAPGAVDVDPSTVVAVTFDRPVDAVVLELRDPSGVPVPATTDHQPGSTVSVLRPTLELTGGVVHTATLVSAVDDRGSATSVSWSFRVADPVETGSTVVDLFGAAVPATASAADTAAVELGMRFGVTQPAEAVGIRFHRGPGNDGPHVGRLWRSDGTVLGEVGFDWPDDTFGWRTALFTTPIPLDVGPTYVVSYLAPVGRYSIDVRYFGAEPVVNGFLVGRADDATTRNGVFAYGGGFPTGTYLGSNYWVDVIVRSVT
jgi:hypothetical protein